MDALLGGFRRPTTFVFLILSHFILSGSSVLDSENIQIVSAERRIDLTSHIVKISMNIKVENTGSSSVSEILLAFPPDLVGNLALLRADSIDGKRRKKSFQPLDVKPTAEPDAQNGTQLFSISLQKQLRKDGTATIQVFYILTHSLEPFPSEIGQSDSQLVYFHGSAVIFSPYSIKQQTTYIKTPSRKVESFTRFEPTSYANTELKYGPYDNQSPYSLAPINIHFEHNYPFAVVEDLVREIEVSHWGSLQIKEHYKIVNTGARLTGVFSRLEYQSKPSKSMSSIRNLIANLPSRVHSVFYRDELGNISSSHLRTNFIKSELEIEPRYPLFGGWKTAFSIGYGVPLEDFLFESDGKRYLNFSFGCPMEGVVVDKLTIKVALPEGSKNPYAVVPFRAEQKYETSYSYLDVVGRPVVVLEKKNVVPEHNRHFQVYYEFNPALMLVEPLMLVSVFFLIFVTCLAYFHVDLSIGGKL